MMAFILGAFSLIGCFVWASGVITVAAVGEGDYHYLGKGALPGSHLFFLMMGSLYLFLVFLSCLPFMRRKLLLVTGIVAHLVLTLFAGFIIMRYTEMARVLVLFAFFGIGWFELYRNRTYVAVTEKGPQDIPLPR